MASESADRQPYGSSNSESLGSIIGALAGNKPSPSPVTITGKMTGCDVKAFKPTKDSKFNNERIVMVTSRHVPFMVCSIIPYSKKNNRNDGKTGNSKRTTSGNRSLSTVDTLDVFDSLGVECGVDSQEVSYAHLLIPTKQTKDFKEDRIHTVDDPTEQSQKCKYSQHAVARTKVLSRQPEYKCCSLNDQETNPPQSLTPESKEGRKENLISYHPNLLDDPELISGKHRTLLTFTSYMTSVVDYVKPSDLKKEINDKFKNKFPHVELTLSKLRSLKREMRKITKTECNIDLLIVAQAYVYFEKLILRGLINKQNRKLIAGASLLLSAKLNDVKEKNLKNFIEKTESTFRLNRKDLISAEFAVLVALDFELHVPIWEILPHYQRIMYES